MYVIGMVILAAAIAAIGIVFAVKIVRLERRERATLHEENLEKIKVLERENYILKKNLAQLKIEHVKLTASPLEKEVNAWKTEY